MSDLTYTPVEVERHLRRLLNELSQAVKTNDETYRAFLDAKRALDKAEAHAFSDSKGQGTVGDREAYVTLAVMGEREAADNAEAAYKYAKSRMDMLKIQIMGVQSIRRSVNTAYGAVGQVEP